MYSLVTVSSCVSHSLTMQSVSAERFSAPHPSSVYSVDGAVQRMSQSSTLIWPDNQSRGRGAVIQGDRERSLSNLSGSSGSSNLSSGSDADSFLGIEKRKKNRVLTLY